MGKPRAIPFNKNPFRLMLIANKTTIRFDDTKVEFGAFGVDRHLMHPIFQWLDYSYKDYGGFAMACFCELPFSGSFVVQFLPDTVQWTPIDTTQTA